MTAHADQAESLVAAVRQRYGKIAEGELPGCCGPSTACCGTDPAGELSASLGYSKDQQADLAKRGVI